MVHSQLYVRCSAKSCVDLDAFMVARSVHGGSNGYEQLRNVEMVKSVPIDGLVASDVTLNKGGLSSASVFMENWVEVIHLKASSIDVDDSEGEAVSIKLFQL